MNYSGSFRTGGNPRREKISHYAKALDYVIPVLRFFRPHFRRMASILLAAALLGMFAQMLAPRTYVATAIIQPELRGSEAIDKNTPVPNLEANMLLASQIQLIKSETMQRRVAEALTRQDETTQRMSTPSRILDVFRRLANVKSTTQVDRMAAQIKDRLIVSYVPGSYLIQILYTAPTQAEAARVANATAAEAIRSSRSKKLAERQAIAEANLRALSMTFGERHPQIVQARSDVESARAAVDAEKDAITLMSERDLAATGLVVPADAALAKRISRYGRFLMFVFLGLLGAIGTALFLEREEALRMLAGLWARTLSFRQALDSPREGQKKE